MRRGVYRVSGSQSRGFAILVVMLVVSLMTIVAGTLLDLVGVDISIVGQHRRNGDSRSVVDGAIMEVLDDQRVLTALPDFTTPGLKATYAPGSGTPSAFRDSALQRDYTAETQLLRFVTVGESSGRSRALVYEVTAIADVGDGAATSEVRSQVFIPVAVPPGILLPRVHAR